MGLLDDLAMGFGFKERTEDYDARTAKTIAMNEAISNAPNQQMATMMMSKLNSGGTISPSSAMYQGLNLSAFDEGTQPNMESILASERGPHRRFIASRGYDEGYTPQIAEDNRPFSQRFLTSPESPASPTPYAIGPVSMDQPLPSFGLLGLFTNGLGGLFSRDSGSEMGPARTTVRPRLRPDLGFPMNNGQPETGEEDFSGVDVYDPETDYIEPDFSLVKPATTAAQEFAENQDFLDTVQSAIDIAEETKKPPLSNSNYYDPTGAFGLRKGTSSIIRLPNGKFVDTLTGKYL